MSEKSTGGLGRAFQTIDDVSTDLPDIPAGDDSETPFQSALNTAQTDQLAKIHALFTSDMGQAVLAWMKALTTDRAVIDADYMFAVSPEKMMARAFFREGENETVRRIEKAIRDFETLDREET
jgi:hypothetical protein